ncbi:unnamed protein product [Rodentolepis nana]|uniref:Uncharacterized protein n=1 Tax=Rodentolepis nana TaxID=102285 RepID=A0A0R3TB49_RODNA|nr:unnamed protein product [Rodentolepis nana]
MRMWLKLFENFHLSDEICKLLLIEVIYKMKQSYF